MEIVTLLRSFFLSFFVFFEDFFPSLVVREDPILLSSVRCVLLYVSGRCTYCTSTLSGLGGFHLSSSKLYFLSTIDNLSLVINSWLIRGLSYQ